MRRSDCDSADAAAGSASLLLKWISRHNMKSRFIVDNNIGKLARWLRLMGYDTLLFHEKDDNRMLEIALDEDRVILTRDSQFMRRRLVITGMVKAMLVRHDDPEVQVREVAGALDLDYSFKPFSLCLECNEALIPRRRADVQHLVPHHVYETQTEYTQCPACHRVYWRGTHWEAMVSKLQALPRDDIRDNV